MPPAQLEPFRKERSQPKAEGSIPPGGKSFANDNYQLDYDTVIYDDVIAYDGYLRFPVRHVRAHPSCKSNPIKKLPKRIASSYHQFTLSSVASTKRWDSFVSKAIIPKINSDPATAHCVTARLYHCIYPYHHVILSTLIYRTREKGEERVSFVHPFCFFRSLQATIHPALLPVVGLVLRHSNFGR